MKAIEFQEEIKKAYYTHFPNGYINIRKLALGDGISIFCGLIGDINDVSAQIRQNDPITFRAYIHDNIKFNDSDTELMELIVEFDGVYISVLPKNKHLYCESHKVPVRKIKGDTIKVIASLNKYFKKLKDTVTELAENKQIIEQDKIPIKYL